ncbi:nucleotide-diphospho-sugar transferase [Fibrella sp. HMF5335]|uniref:Nucleotide-diphospho-sugar transferase n=1 Tax=Fibrella rubiginis TaxID=2817060 RepID=A0A939K5N0_9BACT|nr:nucleotide-diphospho-sugar transferase [Fibrella rubiginis]MBO0937943.1 nucleotide-diphospho-sugar transferase [Fibrella rubiginis]
MIAQHTPILLIMFNRPDHARRVFERIRAVRPTALFLAVDGPRANKPAEADLVWQCQSIASSIDWPCQVHTLFRTENRGCKQAVSEAIDWFFSEVEAGIVLEDDCLPDPTFFTFCADLLSRYANDNRVMHINGANLATGHWWGNKSYLFTKVCHVWGWASWRRAWQQYDLGMNTYPARRDTLLAQQVTDKSSRVYWRQVFDKVYANKIDTWDYQWVYSIWAAGGLCVLPAVNLITNIGFDAEATHTKFITEFSAIPTTSLTDIRHPNSVCEQLEATEWLFRTLYRRPSRLAIWVEKVKRRLPL